MWDAVVQRCPREEEVGFITEGAAWIKWECTGTATERSSGLQESFLPQTITATTGTML